MKMFLLIRAARLSLVQFQFVSVVVLLVMGAWMPTLGKAQDKDDNFHPGLSAVYSSGRKKIQKVDADISFVWEDSSPDPRLPDGPFSTNWAGQLLVRQEGQYRLHAFLLGEVRVKFGGKPVLFGKTSKLGWLTSDEFQLEFGEQQIDIQFRKTNDSARVHLYWSSDQFPLEPIPSHLLFRDKTNDAAAQIERGRSAFAAHRCNRCHVRDNDPPSPVAPAMTTIAAGMNHGWLLKKLIHSDQVSPHSRMPSFGFLPKEAKAVAAFLLSQSSKVKLSGLPKRKIKSLSGERRQGEILLRSLGCLACHHVGKHGSSAPFSGGDLTYVASKRSAEWFYDWLAQPKRLNVDHRMPVFRLTTAERHQLALALANLGQDHIPNKTIQFDAALVKQGRQLVQQARCAACHRLTQIEVDVAGIPDLSDPVSDWNQSCLHPDPDRTKRRPAYQSIDRKAVEAYVESRFGPLSLESRFARGERILEQRNCLQCHERSRGKGIVPVAGDISRIDNDLRGQSQALIPPALTAIGDKLLDSGLATAISGEQKTSRLPWLRVRMPRFEHSLADKTALLTFLVGHDRIPDSAPTIQDANVADVHSESKTLIVGSELVGAKGFSCNACHRIGEYAPRNVAMGTRGSDLAMMAGRMRKSYFLRWTRSPLRIVPGMEMPSYMKAVPGLLDGDINQQINVMWHALNDPRFKAPTNPSAVEQYFVVGKNQPPRIVRDVFTNPKENGGGYISRAFAVGFNNGHNFVFDLNAKKIRMWSFGDFARQRTSGKSWYWNLAGTPLMSGFQPNSDFALIPHGKDDKLILPSWRHGTNGKVESYITQENSVVLRYQLRFEIGEHARNLAVTEVFSPFEETKQPLTGWQRRIAIRSADGTDNLLTKYDVVLIHTKAKSVLGAARIRLSPDPKLSIRSIGNDQFTPITTVDSLASIKLRYTSNLNERRLELKTKPQSKPSIQRITSAPGLDGLKLPLDDSIMPTSITWLENGILAIASLKGDIYLARDTNGDGIEDKLILFEEGLSAPYGILSDNRQVDPKVNGLFVSHKPELLWLADTDGDGRADKRVVYASGWGFNDNYHDWATGIARDSKGNLYLGLGSDYAQKGRPREFSRWRGKVLIIRKKGQVEPFAHEFRYPTGLAIDAHDNLFVSDNQGVQNSFNEINLTKFNQHYGVPSLYEEKRDAPKTRAAIQIPHPWTRSVNGLFFLKGRQPLHPFAGHGVGCEFNGRLLVRFTYQTVGDSLQGAVYYLTRPNVKNADENFLGPLCGAISPSGHIYVGSIHDSGWSGGRNTGSIVRLTANGKLPNGIRELRAIPDGFEIEYIRPINRKTAGVAANYTISGYTRNWKGGYATPDSGRYRVGIKSIEIAPGDKIVRLHVNQLKERFVYEVTCSKVNSADGTELWPKTGHYTMNQIPKK